MAPQCVAIIPDGNRRWATRRKLSPLEGHRQGLLNLRCITQFAFREMQTSHLAIWCASKANLNRDRLQVEGGFQLFKMELRERLRRDDKMRVCLRGIWRDYTTDRIIHDLATMVEKKTDHYRERQLTLLVGYNSTLDIEQATQQLYDKWQRPTSADIRKHMWTSHMPNVDLLIRTGVEGDHHDSEPFLALERENAQIVYSNKLWPDFTEADFRMACEQFSGRERRMGT